MCCRCFAKIQRVYFNDIKMQQTSEKMAIPEVETVIDATITFTF